jgi:hypothetical protein
LLKKNESLIYAVFNETSFLSSLGETHVDDLAEHRKTAPDSQICDLFL